MGVVVKVSGEEERVVTQRRRQYRVKTTLALRGR